MSTAKHPLGFADDTDTDGLPSNDPVALAAADAFATSTPSIATDAVIPTVPASPVERQLYGYTYASTAIYGSNIPEAWTYTSGTGASVAFVDDGFAAAATATFGDFSTALSTAFGSTSIAEPPGGFHGTSTTGLIGATGVNGTPMGLAPNAEIVGVKVTFGTVVMQTLASAEAYAGNNAWVVNNSWGFTGYGSGAENDPAFAVWYSTISTLVSQGRDGLGTIITFAAGNDRADANDLAVQPITSDYQVIAVAATDADGLVASYSTPGAALLVSAIGDNIALISTSGIGYDVGSGTSFAAPAVAAIAAMMLAVNPDLGWRDVQEILADSAYAPPPSAGSFTTNAATDWNGGGMQFSNDLGFGVVDADVAVNLARAWTEQSTSANLVSQSVSDLTPFTVGENATATAKVTDTADVRIQHVEITIDDTYLPVAWSKIVLTSPGGTQSVLLDQTGLVDGIDQTGSLDISGYVIDSNAFWGENARGTWTLSVEDIGGTQIGTITSFSLTFLGDNAATSQAPLVYTPEFALIADPARDIVNGTTATTLDLIALAGTTSINLGRTSGLIDGVAVTVKPGELKNLNADGSTGSVTLIGSAAGGDEFTGGDGTTSLTGFGHDVFNAGLGTTSITSRGNSDITLSSLGPSSVQVISFGGDTIWAGSATATVTDTGTTGDTVYDQAATLTFINGGGASTLYAGTGTVIVHADGGGGVYYAGSGGGSMLLGGPGAVTFYGAAAGDTLIASGSGTDTLIAGAGSELLSGGNNTGSVVEQAGTGTDSLVAGLGTTTFVVGTGNDTIRDLGTSDVIEIVNGAAGGLETVLGFRLGVDDLDLIGYRNMATTTTLGSAVSDGHGGTLMTLPDHTQIDLVGVAKVTAAAFG